MRRLSEQTRELREALIEAIQAVPDRDDRLEIIICLLEYEAALAAPSESSDLDWTTNGPRDGYEQRDPSESSDPGLLAAELDRHWLYLRPSDGAAVCTCEDWSLLPTEAEPIKAGEHLPQFSRHVAEALIESRSVPASREAGPALVAHNHEALGCDYPCNVVAGTMEPKR